MILFKIRPVPPPSYIWRVREAVPCEESAVFFVDNDKRPCIQKSYAIIRPHRRGGRVVEGAPLLREYTSKAYRGFESHPLRHHFDFP